MLCAFWKKKRRICAWSSWALNDNILEVFERGLTDILITLDSATSERHPKQHLFSEEFVVVGWAGNPHLKNGLSLETYLSLGHIVTKFGRTRMPSFEDWYLKLSKHERRVEASVPGFALVPPLLVGTNRLATVHRHLAETMAENYQIKVMEAPIDIPAVNLSIQWHESATADKAVNWMIDTLSRIAQEKTGEIQEARDLHSDVFKKYGKDVLKSNVD